MDGRQKLNQAQSEAVEHHNGPLLILAGAGAGKTKVIIERISAIVRSGIAPEKILAVTFTNKAAKEMRERLTKVMQSDLTLSPYDTPRRDPFIGTFHRLSLHILKTFHDAAGLPARFTIYDRADSTRTLREAITAAGFDPKQLEPRAVMAVMGRQKGSAVGQKDFLEFHAKSYRDEAIGEVWGRYETALRKEKALDFDDILFSAYTLLKRHAPAREYFQNAWSHIHVDEYQDTNRVQYEIIKILSAHHMNVAAVGDADQNIYSWRGASIEHIMNFENDFPNARVLVLAENYRSTKTIIQAANDAIGKNVNRRDKELYTNNADGENIALAGFANEADEATFVAREASTLIKKGTRPEEIAVLYRANFQSRLLEEAFLRSGVPYQVLGTRFFERKEVKDTLSYLRAALNPDSAPDMTRAIGSPPRGIGKVTLAKIINHQEEGLPPAAREKIRLFRETLSRIQTAIEEKTASDAVRTTLIESGLSRLYENSNAEDAERLENLKELVTVATKYDHLPGGAGIELLIEEAALQSDQDELEETKNGVKLMTIHASKGLEFDAVFLTGMEEGLFPHERMQSREGGAEADEEEERRLFYVALTRAKKQVYMSYAMTRLIFGSRRENMPSIFLTELDPELTRVILFPFSFDETPTIT